LNIILGKYIFLELFRLRVAVSFSALFPDMRQSRGAVALVLAACIALCSCDLLAASRLEMCVNTGDPTALNCTQKMVVALSVRANQHDAQVIEAFVDAAVDAAGTTRKLVQPVRIAVSAASPLLSFPINFVQVRLGRWRKC
jgi:hypothetical protein